MQEALPYSLISIAVAPLITFIAMRGKSALCNSHQRMPVLFMTDMRVVIASNICSQLLLLLWTLVLPVHFSLLLAFDLLLGIPLEHWLLKFVIFEDSGSYHVPGAYARKKLTRRYSLAIVFAVLIRSSITALCVAIQATATATATATVTGTAELTIMQLLVQLLMYTFVRTLFVDVVPRCQEQSPVVEHELRTDSFVITDEEDDIDDESNTTQL